MSAQLLTVRLCRGDATPWGFRLQGGADFGTPLLVQKVNEGSLAHQAGLLPGDSVLKINDYDVYTLRHKDAQDIVVRSGNNFSMTVQRGGLWRPQVTPVGQLPSHQSRLGSNVHTVTRTSLAHQHPQPVEHIGCGYNNAARPFGATNGTDGHVKSIVNKQYNTPVGIYSDESIAETLTAQAEVLAGGVLGVNFKKHEKEYNPVNSEVLKYLQEEQTEPREPAHYNNSSYSHHATTQHQHQHQHQHQQQHHQPTGVPVKHVSAPTGTPKVNAGGLPAGQNICDECERLIVGVFCRIKDKNLHVECFKCATCGTSLKNQGYYNFNNKLYCEIHARAAAMKNPPPGTEGYEPIPLKPTPKLSASHITNALSAHGYNLQTNGATPGLVVGSGPPSGGHVNQGYAPRPFNQGPMSPQSGGQRSPGASWGGQPKGGAPAYATLPRTGGAAQGRHSYHGTTSYSSSYNSYKHPVQVTHHKSHVTFGPSTTYHRPAPRPAYNNAYGGYY